MEPTGIVQETGLRWCVAVVNSASRRGDMRDPRHVRRLSAPFFGILVATAVGMVGVTAYGYYRVRTAQPFTISTTFLDADTPTQRP